VGSRCVYPYEEQVLPEFEQEALIVTTTGLSGYRRPENDQSNAFCCVAEKYVRGSKWEPATIAWHEMEHIRLFHADGGNYCQQTNDPDPKRERRDPELSSTIRTGIMVPCWEVPCCEQNIPKYTRLEIQSSTADMRLQVVALKEDENEVVNVLKKEWTEGLLRTVTTSIGLNAVQQMLANTLRRTEDKYCHDIVKRDGTFENFQDAMIEPLRQRREQLIGTMDFNTAVPLRFASQSGESHVYCKRYTCRKADDIHLTNSGRQSQMCSTCKELNDWALKMLNQRCKVLVEQMDIDAVRAAFENEHVEEDKRYTGEMISRLLQNRLMALEGS